MKFLAKWYLLFFIALSSLVFVGCDGSSPEHRLAHSLERDYGFSHGTALFISAVVFTLVYYFDKKRRG
ncbi:hypothetical protein Taitung35_08860 [Helicobacter pylori]|uniref:hypothetical protein n=1 Tax=Helicobacter pylori TaxID=210 RepID=UPI00036433FD|nr:hypothetical protein [Helicobacter pylori]EQL54408.1 hypothetical protein N404_02095 [Helicobacter pylori FD506]WQZ51350.1 hypothetical protein E5P85_06255 [Helicobacter pylori]